MPRPSLGENLDYTISNFCTIKLQNQGTGIDYVSTAYHLADAVSCWVISSMN